MKVIQTDIPDVIIIEPRVYRDQRGHFLEVYQEKKYQDAGIAARFVQDNLSFSVKNVVRGMHYQITRPQAKLVQAVSGTIFDVAVDLRTHSPTFKKWVGVVLSEENLRQLFIPEGFAHGFRVLSETAHFHYKCTDFYHGDDEGGFLWSDPHVGIEWDVENPVVSDRDSVLPLLEEIPEERLPHTENGK